MNSTVNLPLISVVIPNYNGSGFLENCLRSLQSQSYQRMEVLVVDNGSRDASTEIVRKTAPGAILLEKDRNLGFAGAVNEGIRVSRGEWVAVLNNDTVVHPEWLAECARGIAEHPDASFFACRIMELADHGRIYSAGDCYLRAGIGYRRGQERPDRNEFHSECPIFSACGCAALYSRPAIEKAGRFDDRFFAYLEDTDLALRLQSGECRGYYLPRAQVFHHGGGTSGVEFSPIAVRLRTRNSLLLLLKSLPGTIIIRCLPMILLSQLFWLLRVLAHMRLGSYLRGLGGAFLLAPAAIRDRARMRPAWRSSGEHLWREILKSESLARNDFKSGGDANSVFLKWYFRIFRDRESQVSGRRLQH